MREKRVNVLVLTCSVLVATCASASHCFVTAGSLDKYVAVVSSVLISGQINSASAATVWIPTEEAEDTSGNVNDEFQEVAHVLARPGTRVVRTKEEDDITHQPVPWTSLKDEWKIFQRIQESKRKSPADKLKKKTGQKVQPQADEEGSSEEDDGEDEEEEEDEPRPPQQADEEASSEEEDDGAESRSSVVDPNAPLSEEFAQVSGKSRPKPVSDENPPLVKKANSKSDSLPLAFYGQQNHDDDEKDFIKDEATIFKKKKVVKKEVDDDDEEDDTSASNEQAASVEDYADYAVDDDDDDEQNNENGSKEAKKKKDGTSFEDIPLAIREMILNDLANQNNGTGYHPSLVPKVTGGGSSGSAEHDGSSENDGNSSEEDDNNAAEVPNRDISDPDPTPPASSKPKKGDDEDEEYAEGGKGKGKGKKKKGKQKKGGWGWKPKPKGWGHVHIPPGWGEKHDHGWGWGDKHDGVLEQLVKGSTWERVLKYYHWKRDESVKGEGHHGHGHDHHDHHGEDHPGLEWAPFDPHLHAEAAEHGWGWKGGSGIKKIVKKAFHGSFWERAVHTYAKYKENQAKNPKKPALIDLDSDHLNLGR